MFGPHDNLSVARGIRFLSVRAVVLWAPVIVGFIAAPMLLVLLPLAFAGLPFLLVSFLSGASRNRFETRRLASWRLPVAQPA